MYPAPPVTIHVMARSYSTESSKIKQFPNRSARHGAAEAGRLCRAERRGARTAGGPVRCGAALPGAAAGLAWARATPRSRRLPGRDQRRRRRPRRGHRAHRGARAGGGARRGHQGGRSPHLARREPRPPCTAAAAHRAGRGAGLDRVAHRDAGSPARVDDVGPAHPADRPHPRRRVADRGAGVRRGGRRAGPLPGRGRRRPAHPSGAHPDQRRAPADRPDPGGRSDRRRADDVQGGAHGGRRAAGLGRPDLGDRRAGRADVAVQRVRGHAARLHRRDPARRRRRGGRRVGSDRGDHHDLRRGARVGRPPAHPAVDLLRHDPLRELDPTRRRPAGHRRDGRGLDRAGRPDARGADATAPGQRAVGPPGGRAPGDRRRRRPGQGAGARVGGRRPHAVGPALRRARGAGRVAAARAPRGAAAHPVGVLAGRCVGRRRAGGPARGRRPAP